eukprot:8425623-Heterocapsa_arctica.AAC.1
MRHSASDCDHGAPVGLGLGPVGLPKAISLGAASIGQPGGGVFNLENGSVLKASHCNGFGEVSGVPLIACPTQVHDVLHPQPG